MSHTWLSKFIDKITRRHRRGTLLGDETLLDLQIRAYLRSEYANEIPPSGAFPRLMRAVQLHREEQRRIAEATFSERVARNIKRLGRALPGLYHTLGRAHSARIISSGMVTALMLLAMWPSMKQMLASHYLAPNLVSHTSDDSSSSGYDTDLLTPKTTVTPLIGIEGSEFSYNPVDEQRRISIVQRAGQVLKDIPTSDDPNYLHPFARGLGKKASRTSHERPIIGQE
jgi:hypothetical protein